MKYIGLDIATTTGWSFFEDGVLIERGIIQLIAGMELPQKLHHFHIELNNLLVRLSPEYCFIEDVILGISGAKILSFLARLNGVAINTAFGVLQQNVKLYTPVHWKANSFPGLSGTAKKWQIQLAAIKYYDIPITGNFDDIATIIENADREITNEKTKLFDARHSINKLKASLVRKRNPLSDNEKIKVTGDINTLVKLCDQYKSNAKILQRKFDSRMQAISNDIISQTGMTADICDSCGVALCGWNELNSSSNS